LALLHTLLLFYNLLTVITSKAVAGTTLCFFAFNRMTMLKVPDLYVEMYNATKKEVFPSLFASTYGSLRSWSIFFLIPLIVHCFVMVAWAKRRAAQEMHKNGLAISGKKQLF